MSELKSVVEGQTSKTVESKSNSEMENWLFAADLKKVHDSNESLDHFSPVFSSIDLVFVLSGRGSALKEPVDHADVMDPEDDYHRMLKGIEIAKRVSACRGIQIPIFYCGRNKHNEHLMRALENGVFDYPKELFIIRSIFPENTIGQAKAFKELLKDYPCSTIAIVSSAYHVPRVARTFGNTSPTAVEHDASVVSNLEKANLLLFGIDREFVRPGSEKDRGGEINAMKNYSSDSIDSKSKPIIARYQPPNTFMNVTDILFKYSFDMQKETVRLFPTKKLPMQSKLKKLQKAGKEKRIGKIPSTLKLITGDLQKYLKGEDEVLFFSKVTQEAIHESPGDSKSKREHEVIKQEEGEKSDVLNHILFMRVPESRDNVVVSEKHSLIMCLLLNCEHLTEGSQGENSWQVGFASVHIKMLLQNLSSNFYFTNKQKCKEIREFIEAQGFRFKRVQLEICSVGLMPPEVGKDLFDMLEESLIDSNESTFLQKLCTFKERSVAEVLCRKKIKQALKDKRDPDTLDEVLQLANEFHEAVVAKNYAKGLISYEDSQNTLILDDSSLALDLALDISKFSFSHAIKACAFYSRGAYFNQAAAKLKVHLTLGYQAQDHSTPLSDKITREMRSKALHTALSSWQMEQLNTDGLEILFKLLESQAGLEWFDSENQLFYNYKEAIKVFKNDIYPEKRDCFFGSLINTIAEAVYQHSPQFSKTSWLKRSSEVEALAQSGEVKTSIERDKILEGASSSKGSNVHPIVQWFSEDLTVPFPKRSFSPNEKANLKLPETLKFISGNVEGLEELLTNAESVTKIIFSVNRNEHVKPISSSEASKASQGDSKEWHELKESKERSEHLLSHIVFCRNKCVFLDNREASVLSIMLLFNSTFIDRADSAVASNPPEMLWLREYAELSKTNIRDIADLSRFNGFPVLYPERFQGGRKISFCLELMSQDLIETLLDTLTIRERESQSISMAFTIQEAAYFKKIFAFPISIREHSEFGKIKQKLREKDIKGALMCARKYHESIQRKALEEKIMADMPEGVHHPLENTKMAFFLGEYLEKEDPRAAIEAFEIVSEGSHFRNHAKMKIFDIIVQCDKKEAIASCRRNLRKKGILAYFLAINNIHDQEKLDNLVGLVAHQAGLKPENMKPLSLKTMLNLGMDGLGYLILGLIEPLLDRLYEYRKQFGMRPVKSSSTTVTFAYPKKLVEGEDNGVKGLDEDDENEDDDQDLENISHQKDWRSLSLS